MYTKIKKKIKRDLNIKEFNLNKNYNSFIFPLIWLFTIDKFSNETYYKKQLLILTDFNKKIGNIYHEQKKNTISSKSEKLYSYIKKKELFAFTEQKQTISVDIVQGIPKLNSLLELTYTTKKLNNLEINYQLQKNNLRLFISSYNLKINKEIINIKNKLNLKKKINKVENINPEKFLWYYFTKLLINNQVEKSLFHTMSKTKKYLVNSLTRIYIEQNIKLKSKIFSCIINVMFSRIIIVIPLYNPFFYLESLDINVYSKIYKIQTKLGGLQPIVIPCIEGISKSVKKNKNLLNVISFSDTINNLINKCLFGANDWLLTIKSNLILSQKLKIGTNIKNLNQKYYRTFNNIIK